MFNDVFKHLKGFKTMLFIRTKHSMQIFRVIPLNYKMTKQQLNSEKTIKKMRWRAKTLICFWFQEVCCFCIQYWEECWHDNQFIMPTPSQALDMKTTYLNQKHIYFPVFHHLSLTVV